MWRKRSSIKAMMHIKDYLANIALEIDLCRNLLNKTLEEESKKKRKKDDAKCFNNYT